MSLWENLNEQQLRQRRSCKWNDMLGEDGKSLDGAWVAEMDYGTAPEIESALQAAMRDGLYGYLPRAAADAAKHSLVKRLHDVHKWQVDEGNVMLSPDVLTVLRVMIRLQTAPGDTVIVPTPCYMPFLRLPAAEGRTLLEVPSVWNEQEQEWEFDWGRLEAAFAKKESTLAVLCNPWNPTGRVLSEQELRRFGELALAHGVHVFSDEIHAPLVYSPAQHRSLASLSPELAEITVTGLAASKGWNVAGLKCAQAVIGSSQLEKWHKYDADFALQKPAPFGVLAAEAAYSRGQSWLDETLAYLDNVARQTREIILEICPSLRIPHLQGTYLQLWDCSHLKLNPEQIQRAKLKVNVGAISGSCMGSDFPSLVRFNVAAPKTVTLKMAQRLASALADEKSRS